MPSLCFSQLSSGWSLKQGFMLFIAAAIPVPQSQYFSYMCDLLQLAAIICMPIPSLDYGITKENCGKQDRNLTDFHIQ